MSMLRSRSKRSIISRSRSRQLLVSVKLHVLDCRDTGASRGGGVGDWNWNWAEALWDVRGFVPWTTPVVVLRTLLSVVKALPSLLRFLGIASVAISSASGWLLDEGVRCLDDRRRYPRRRSFVGL